MDHKEQLDKFKKHEVEFTRYLKAKYFSDKDIYGDPIFTEKAVSDGMTLKVSSRAGTESYADPVKFLEDNGSTTKSGAETPANSNEEKGSVNANVFVDNLLNMEVNISKPSSSSK